MDEIGIIKEINGIFATVSVARKSACNDCQADCKLAEEEALIEAVNAAKATTGQKVRVVMKPYTYLKGSLLVYGLPALSLILGAVFGKEYMSSFLKNTDPDILSAIFGFGAFILSFVFVKLWSRRIEKKTEYKPVVEEILE
ncbi:MAG TPA: SoxR reducing system RseC family protein [Thermodesulfovibrionales bacterium]|nr:SoxR reducing system RseC family protein [Thermodesulfovibrionales bacterium]